MTLDASKMMRDAEQASGLSDWGDFDFSANLRVLLREMERTAGLSAIGRQRMSQRIAVMLENRLRLAAERAATPAIAREQITRPIFILGLPRSGTSNLLSLLARDPGHRVPRMWEMLRPCPAPERATRETDPRIGEAQRILLDGGFDSKELNAAHPFNAGLPDECGFIFEHSFAAMPYAAYMHLPGFIGYSIGPADWNEVYGFHRQFLQHLQSRHRGERWVLKTPEHNLHIPQLLAAYPDAILLNTVRDPAKVLPSLTSNFVSLRKLFAEEAGIDKRDSARAVLDNIQTSVERMMTARQDLAVDRHFYDIDFHDLTGKPLEAIAGIYRHFDLPFSAEAQAAMRDYVDNEARALHGHGGHSYTMAEYGFDPDQIDASLAPYMKRFNVTVDART